MEGDVGVQFEGERKRERSRLDERPSLLRETLNGRDDALDDTRMRGYIDSDAERGR